MTSKEILSELKAMGSPSVKNIFLKHGAKEPFYGVKVGDMKTIVKKIKKNHALALELFDSGISDAMYLAGLIADDAQMTQKHLNDWVKKANWYMLSEYTVPWVAAGSPYGHELALEWIASKDEKIASSGWVTYGCLLALKEDKDLDLKEIKALVDRIQKDIHKAPNRVRFTMNNFIICVGGYSPALSDYAIASAKKIGKVEVNLGETACKVPFAPEYIENMKKRGSLTKKKKSVKC
ncbi:MAG TPA: DNA alkylation repair protein [Bacteroidia bacterium]|jgi:3-methyladenine DNA glycosylase AlkD|nr:DNA alkylation repair protein [Bacteroidia bacterium]